MLALYQHNWATYYAQNYAGILPSCLKESQREERGRGVAAEIGSLIVMIETGPETETGRGTGAVTGRGPGTVIRTGIEIETVTGIEIEIEIETVTGIVRRTMMSGERRDGVLGAGWCERGGAD